MKKTLFALAALALVAVSCKKDGGDDTTKETPLDATLELTTEVAELPYGEPFEVTGTVTTTATLDSYVLTAVKKVAEGEYVAVGEAQTFAAEGNEMKVEYFADTKEMTDLEVAVKAGNKVAKFYFPTTVEGEAWASAWANDAMVLYADNKVAHNVNDNVNYPLENTGAGSDTKSFFSMHGVEVNGKIEHVLSLNELLAVDGKNASMCWLNCLEKTDALPKEDGSVTFIGGQRGYMFSGMRKASLGGGTTGRQCDTQNYDGHQILDANIDYDFEFLAVPGSWIGEKYNEDLYKLVDRIWLAAPGTATNLDQLKTIYALSEIQKQLDNSTLGVEDTPTSLGGKTYLRRWADAGHNSTKTVVENFRAGDYVVFRSKKTEGEATVYYYGLMQILQLPDDSAAFVTKEDTGRRYIDQTLAYDLFMKPAYFAVKTQCQIQK